MGCPEAMSPSATVADEDELGYFLLKEHAICGDVTVGTRLSTTIRSLGDCAALVRAEKCGATEPLSPCRAFSYGEWYKKGYCYKEHFEINDALIADWQMDRTNPDAPCT